MNYITFDIETYNPVNRDNFSIDEFRVSVTGAYISWTDQYLAFMEDETKEFIDLLKKADLIIGYNQLWFDLPVLQKYSDVNLLKLPNYDILVEVQKKLGYKMKLDDLCKANFGTQKTDSYEVYKNYYWDKNWFPLIDYCMNDVRLTEQLFKQIVNTRTVKYNDLQEVKEIVLDKPEAGKVEFTEEMDSIF